MTEQGRLLETAIRLALDAHAGQIDKGGAPYILHPLRVMLACDGPEERIVAVLHDVLEDSGVTAGQMREAFGERIADAVSALTKRDGESYEDFIVRCGRNLIARTVKQHDITDNMDVRRLGRDLTPEDVRRQEKYAAARKSLRALTAGPLAQG